MKRMSTPVAGMVVRMKRLPRRHRIAHLRALIAREPACSIRKEELAALLRDEMMAQIAQESRAG
jgi:hypothetical protein